VNGTSYTGLQVLSGRAAGNCEWNGPRAEVRAATGLGPTAIFQSLTGQPSAEKRVLGSRGSMCRTNGKIRSNVSLTYGFRFETQNQIHDQANPAPRIGLAWGINPGPKGQPKTVLRAGWGMFYDRFTQDLLLQAQRLNGVTQQRFIVNDPDFYPNIPTPAETGPLARRRRRFIRWIQKLKSPYTMQAGVTLETAAHEIRQCRGHLFEFSRRAYTSDTQTSTRRFPRTLIPPTAPSAARTISISTRAREFSSKTSL